MANVIKSKEIIGGFKEDFFNIVEEYTQISADLKLVKFFTFWNDNYLDYLFANRFDPRELSEAIIKMNQLLVEVAADTTSSGFTTIQRVVALYFILCLFVKQPNRFRRSIRLTCEDAICIQRFADNHQQMYCDLKFAWNQLKVRGAIDLVEERQLYGPSLLSKRGFKDDTSLLTRHTSTSSESAKFLETKIEPHLEEINQLMQTYLEVKKSLRLDEIDSAVEFETSNLNQYSLRDNVDHAKHLIDGFKHTMSSD